VEFSKKERWSERTFAMVKPVPCVSSPPTIWSSPSVVNATLENLTRSGSRNASRTTQGSAMQHGNNDNLSYRISEALMLAANAKHHAAVLRKQADRKLDAIFLMNSGAVDVRKAMARADSYYIRAEDAAIEAEHAANIAKAKVDAIMCEYELFRTMEATERAKMNLR
jgi:hypothetical protein